MSYYTLMLLPRTADALAQLLTVPPYAVAAVFLCLNSYVSDRIQSRGVFVSYVSAVGGLGYVYAKSAIISCTDLLNTGR